MHGDTNMKYLLLSKTTYIFRNFHKAITKHEHKNTKKISTLYTLHFYARTFSLVLLLNNTEHKTKQNALLTYICHYQPIYKL
jgi:hypothetical protein